MQSQSDTNDANCPISATVVMQILQREMPQLTVVADALDNAT
jgi:hypothetical protein